MTFRIGATLFCVSPLFFIMLCAMMLIDKTGLTSVSVLCSLLHEMGHIFTMHTLSAPAYKISVNVYGMDIEYRTLPSFLSSILISLSGPAANLTAALLLLPMYFLTKHLPIVDHIVVNLILAFINLLPVSGLDGGDVLCNLLLRRFDYDRAKKISSLIGTVTAFSVLSVSVFVLIKLKNPSLILLALYLLMLNLFKM